MNILQSFILGILEGFTEFLPISSTGHLILASHLLSIPETDALKSFLIAVQLGAILAVFTLFYKKFFNIHNLLKLFVAFLPTGVLGLLLYKIIKTYLLGNTLVVCVSLFVGGVILLLVERWYSRKLAGGTESVRALSLRDISYMEAFKLGLFQSIAMIPGVSRSGATIVGGLLMGMPRALVAEFTFLLAVPTMAAATGYDILKNYSLFTMSDFTNIAVGFVTAFVTALIVVRLLLSYVKKHSFVIFGWYRILLALVFAFLFLI
jgi:undecaprenyl-diphosphatase